MDSRPSRIARSARRPPTSLPRRNPRFPPRPPPRRVFCPRVHYPHIAPANAGSPSSGQVRARCGRASCVPRYLTRISLQGLLGARRWRDRPTYLHGVYLLPIARPRSKLPPWWASAASKCKMVPTSSITCEYPTPGHAGRFFATASTTLKRARTAVTRRRSGVSRWYRYHKTVSFSTIFSGILSEISLLTLCNKFYSRSPVRFPRVIAISWDYVFADPSDPRLRWSESTCPRRERAFRFTGSREAFASSLQKKLGFHRRACDRQFFNIQSYLRTLIRGLSRSSHSALESILIAIGGIPLINVRVFTHTSFE